MLDNPGIFLIEDGKIINVDTFAFELIFFLNRRYFLDVFVNVVEPCGESALYLVIFKGRGGVHSFTT